MQDDKTDSARQNKPADKPQGPSDLVTGSVLFAIFLVFMTLWMLFRLPD